MWFTLKVRGKGAHSGMRAESIRPGGAGAAVGVNAADLTHALQAALSELETDWIANKTHPLFRPGSFTIHAGVVQAAPDAGPMPFGLAEHGSSSTSSGIRPTTMPTPSEQKSKLALRVSRTPTVAT